MNGQIIKFDTFEVIYRSETRLKSKGGSTLPLVKFTKGLKVGT